ncbi:MAG: squalene/phytoene synthase family protein [Pseudomonadota bacterium]
MVAMIEGVDRTAAPAAWDEIDARLKRVDEDRWLSSRYAPAPQRRALIALYAFVYELARVRIAVSEPALGAIRFQWWREALEEIAGGAPVRKHDVALAIAEAGLPAGRLTGLIDAYEGAFESKDRAREPDGDVMGLAAELVDPEVAAPWRAQAEALGAAYGAARRGAEMEPSSGAVKAPQALRPALAHAALRRAYASGPPPGPFFKRWRIFRAVLSGSL